MKYFIGLISFFVLFSGLNVSFANTPSIPETVFEKDTTLPLVYINIVSKSGSVKDPIGKSGLTNFMGEMLLRGTAHRSREQLNADLDQTGGHLGVETRAEALIFRGAVLTSQLKPYLALVKEILTQPSFPESEIKKLKSEVISTLKIEQGHDMTLATEKFNRFLFQGHPYGNPTLGTMKDIESITSADLINQYNKLIRDSLILVIGRGDAQKEEISHWTQEVAEARTKALAILPGPLANLPEMNPPLKVSTPTDVKYKRLLLVDKPDRTQTQINIGQIGVKLTDPNYFPLYLGNHAFGGKSFFATLMLEIRVKRGWSYGAYSRFMHGLQPRSWNAHLFPASKDTAAAFKETLRLITDLKTNGLTQEQFDFAKQSLINNAGFMYNTPQKRIENTLLEKTLNLPKGFMESYGSELKKVTLKETNDALKTFLKPDQLTAVVLCTAKDLKQPLADSLGVPEKEVRIEPYTSE